MLRRKMNLRTPTFLLSALLIGAPILALLPFLLNWLPGRVRAVRMKDGVAALATQIAQREAEIATLHEHIEAARAGAVRQNAEQRGRWLLEREERMVFDRCAAAVTGSRVAVRKLVLDQPRVYAGVSRDNFLAADRVEVVCNGDYAGLTQCLDSLAELALPLRFTELTWRRQGREQELRLLLDAPFVPGTELAARIVKKSDLK